MHFEWRTREVLPCQGSKNTPAYWLPVVAAVLLGYAVLRVSGVVA